MSFTEYNDLPVVACVGKCKKSWWSVDLKDRDKDTCPLCGSAVSQAVEGVHFTVLSRSKRALKYKDFKKYSTMTAREKEELKSFISSGAKLSHISVVKKAFEERAKQEWCA